MRGKNLSETKAKFDKYYSDSAPSYGMVQMWFTEFRSGRTNTETIPSPGRSNEITTPKMINEIHDIVLNNPKVKVREIGGIVSISVMGVAIAHNRPKTHTPESREGSKQWVKPSQIPPKRPKTQQSAGKVMPSEGR